MATLGELMSRFNAEIGADGSAVVHDPGNVDAQLNARLESGGTKIASEGGTETSLQDIWLRVMDLDKTAAAGGGGGGGGTAEEPTDEELAAAAEKLAAAEAEALLAAGGGGGADPASEEILKVAAEYDAAGRIMFRGFYDEFLKQAAKLQAAPNQHSETPSAAKTPALGNRGLPTMETNYAGSPNHDQPIPLADKEAYRHSLETSKRIQAGVTGDDPEAAAIAIGGGAPLGFATVRDLMV